MRAPAGPGRTGADLTHVEELRRLLGRRHWDVANEAEDVGAAIDRFRSGSSEFVPYLPPHEARGAVLADRLDEIARRVEDTRDALAAADRWVVGHVGRRMLDGENGRQAAAAFWQTAPGSWARAQRWALDIENGGDRWTRRQVREAVGGIGNREATRIRNEWNTTEKLLRGQYDDAWQRARGAVAWSGAPSQWDETIRDVRRLAGHGPGAQGRHAARVAEDAGQWSRRWAAVSDSRIGAVGRIGARGAAVAGVGIGLMELHEGIVEGDTEQAVKGGLAAAASGAMFIPCPPLQAAAAVVTVGLLVYDYHDEIADAAGALVDGGRAFVGTAVDIGGALLSGELAGEVLGSAWDAVKGLF